MGGPGLPAAPTAAVPPAQHWGTDGGAPAASASASAPAPLALLDTPDPGAAQLTPPLDFWQRDWDGAQAAMERLASHRAAGALWPTPRSAALDAARMDGELTALLGEQFGRVFSLCSQGAVAAVQPELELLLDFLIFSYTVWRGQPTPGMRLLNLRHRDERSAVEHSTSAARVPPVSVVGGRTGAGGPGLTGSQRAMYGFIAVGGRYALARLARASAGRRWADAGAGRHGAAAARGLRVAENVLQAAGLANFVLFLAGGRHRNLLERVIGAGLVPADVAAPRALSFDYLNRQIVWHELSELMLFVLPLIDPGRARRAVRALLPRAGALAGGGAGGGAAGPGSSSSSTSHLGPCGICGAPSPAVPYTALPCGHPHCYWCLAQATAADPRFECGCGKRVAAMIRAARAVGLADGGCPAGGPGGGR